MSKIAELPSFYHRLRFIHDIIFFRAFTLSFINVSVRSFRLKTVILFTKEIGRTMKVFSSIAVNLYFLTKYLVKAHVDYFYVYESTCAL